MNPTLTTTPDDGVLTTTQPDNSVSRGTRFNASMVLMREMASYIADQPSSMFAMYTAALEHFQQKLLDGRVAHVLSALSTMDATPVSTTMEQPSSPPAMPVDQDQPSSTPEVPDTCADTEADVQALAALAMEADSVPYDDAVGSHKPDDGHSLPTVTQVTFKPMPKARGRPPAVRQRPFKVMGRKRKATTSTTSNVAPAPIHPSGASQNCVECGMVEPPKKGRRRNHEDQWFQWLQCDYCDYWYHFACTGQKQMPADNDEFKCRRCINGM